MHPNDVVGGYSKTRQKFSDKMAQIAYESYYRDFWHVIERVPTKGTFWDFKCGIDAILNTESDAVISIAERYREHEYRKHHDLTIRSRSLISGRLLEAKHLLAQFYVYGYANEAEDNFVELYVVNVAKMLDFLAQKKLKYGQERPNKDGSSTLRPIAFNDLYDFGCIMACLVEGQLSRPSKDDIEKEIETFKKKFVWIERQLSYIIKNLPAKKKKVSETIGCQTQMDFVNDISPSMSNHEILNRENTDFGKMSN